MFTNNCGLSDNINLRGAANIIPYQFRVSYPLTSASNRILTEVRLSSNNIQLSKQNDDTEGLGVRVSRCSFVAHKVREGGGTLG